MAKNMRYLVISDDIYVFSTFEGVVSYFEFWNNDSDYLFDSIGRFYCFEAEHEGLGRISSFPLAGCKVSIKDGMLERILDLLDTRGYLKRGKMSSLEDVFNKLESRFGLSD